MSVESVSSASSTTNPFAALRSALQSVSSSSGSVGAGVVQSAAQENMETPLKPKQRPRVAISKQYRKWPRKKPLNLLSSLLCSLEAKIL